MKRVLKDMLSLFAQGPGFRISINVPADELIDESLFRLLDRYWPGTLAHKHLGFELTERSTADLASFAPAISHLRQAGHSVYIDDFGVGYSSMTQINGTAVGVIKLDRSFLDDPHTGRSEMSILPQIIAIAHQLGAGLVVEGIKTEEDVTFFRGLDHAILGQAWLFGRPVPEREFQELVSLGV